MLPQTPRERLLKLRAIGEKILLSARSFSKKERAIFCLFAAIAFVSGLTFLSLLNRSFMVPIPVHGGSLSEGIIGTPRFINPVLAMSDADKDLTMLTYSGLMRKNKTGNLIPDIAKGYEISPDGREYTFTLKNGVRFNDGKLLTADDVVFTIEKIQDSSIRSPKKNSWEGVRAEKINDTTVKFTLRQPYAPFIENTTVGIVPKHIWNGLSPEQWGYSSYNTEPVGTGPYTVSKIQQNSSGIPTSYELRSSPSFVSGEPYIENVRVIFYGNEDALVAGYKAGEIDMMATLSPKDASAIEKAAGRIERTPLPRIYAVFLNQTEQPVFTDLAVRKALNIMTDKQQIIDETLLGFATPAEGPIPSGVIGSDNGQKTVSYADEKARIEAASALLKKQGWTMNEETKVLEKKVKKKPTETLSFVLATSDMPELKAATNLLKEKWAKIGARVEVKVYEPGDLNQNIIRTRKYDALLYGEIIGTDPDPYAYWHSSQRFDPGLNIALYANLTSDKLMEKGRETLDWDERAALYEKFQKEVQNDVPAIFLYSPDFIYVLPKSVRGFSLSGITVLSDRFANINEWYVRTQNVWPAFATIR